MIKESEIWAEENVCKKLCDACIMSNGSKCTSYNYAVEGFDAGVDSLKTLKKAHNDLFVQFNQLIGRHEWHNLKEDPNDIPPAQEYEINGNTDHWNWYLVKTDYTDYKSCKYAICARILTPNDYSGGEDPTWIGNDRMYIDDEHIFEWKEIK